MKHMFWVLICMAMFVGCQPPADTSDDGGADVENVDGGEDTGANDTDA